MHHYGVTLCSCQKDEHHPQNWMQRRARAHAQARHIRDQATRTGGKQGSYTGEAHKSIKLPHTEGTYGLRTDEAHKGIKQRTQGGIQGK